VEFSLKGCQKVADGRSVAQTTGPENGNVATLKGCQKSVHPFWVRTSRSRLSGGLRYAATTGYYLPAFQAEISWVLFTRVDPSAYAGKRKH